MSTPYKDGPSTCPKCGAPTYYAASGDTESQGAFGTHRYVAPLDHVREALGLLGGFFHDDGAGGEVVSAVQMTGNTGEERIRGAITLAAIRQELEAALRDGAT